MVYAVLCFWEFEVFIEEICCEVKGFAWDFSLLLFASKCLSPTLQRCH